MPANTAVASAGYRMPMSTSVSRGISRVCVLLLAVIAALGYSSAPASGETSRSQVVIVGVPGLVWSDIDQARTPRLWNFADDAAIASLSTRTPQGPGSATCPVAGWLTVSAGEPAVTGEAGCGRAPAPQATNQQAQIPGFTQLRRDNADSRFSPTIGLLGTAVHKAGGRVAAIGAGAAYGAVDRHGSIPHYANTVGELGSLDPYALVMVEIDALLSSGELGQAPDLERRQTALSTVDSQVGTVLSDVSRDSTVLLVGLADNSATPHLHVAMAAGPDFRHGTLTANSTRQDGLVTINDIAATTLDTLGIDAPPHGSGRPWNVVKTTASTAQLVDELGRADVAARTSRSLSADFFWWLLYLQLAFYALTLAVIWLSRRATRRHSGVLDATRVAAVLCAGAPLAPTVANFFPWWRWSETIAQGRTWQLGTIIAADVLMAALAFAGPWRRHPLGPPGVMAGITVAVLGLDVVLGLGLQSNSPSGYSPINAGRFFGFGNMTYAMFATAALLGIGVLAYLTRNRRWWMLATAGGVGVVAIAIDGAPMWGADFGGVLALAPAVVVCVILLAGWRVSVLRLGLVGMSGVAIVTLFAWLDSLRAPDSRTHLGAFFADVLAGEGSTDTVSRKFDAMIRTFSNTKLVWIVVASLVFMAIVARWQWRRLREISAELPELRASMVGVAIIATFGLVVNDSGTAVPAAALSLAVPLWVAILLTRPIDQVGNPGAENAMSASVDDRAVAQPVG